MINLTLKKVQLHIMYYIGIGLGQQSIGGTGMGMGASSGLRTGGTSLGLGAGGTGLPTNGSGLGIAGKTAVGMGGTSGLELEEVILVSYICFIFNPCLCVS